MRPSENDREAELAGPSEGRPVQPPAQGRSSPVWTFPYVCWSNLLLKLPEQPIWHDSYAQRAKTSRMPNLSQVKHGDTDIGYVLPLQVHSRQGGGPVSRKQNLDRAPGTLQRALHSSKPAGS